jgi:tetratricopeptide (TPR) repeat protein
MRKLMSIQETKSGNAKCPPALVDTYYQAGNAKGESLTLGYNPAQYIAPPSSPTRRVRTEHDSKGSMKHTPFIDRSLVKLLTLALALSMSAAHADDYADVSQLMRTGKPAEAMAKADQYLLAKPRDPQMRFLKGVIQRDTGKSSDAIVTFTKLTEDFPELPEPYNNLAVLYAGQSQFDKARVALEMAIRTNPSYATAHENLGDVYAKLASQAYNKALQLDGGNAAVPPKLALIRELFSPVAKGQRPTTAAPPVPLNTPTTAAARPAVPAAPPAPTATTKAASAPAPVPPTPVVTADSSGASSEAETAVLAWARAWANKDVPAYLSAYGTTFTPPSGQSRKAWEDERRKRIAGKSRIQVKLERLTVTMDGRKAIVRFRQDYRADSLAVSSRKTLELSKTGDRWLIVRESTGA